MAVIFRSLATRERPGVGTCRQSSLSSPFSPYHFLNQTRCDTFSFKFQGCCFLREFRYYADQKFHNFTVYTQCLDNLRKLFIFSNCIGETDHFLLDLLKKVQYLTEGLLKIFLLWTIQKKTVNESLNIRLYTQSWTYWESPLKQEKQPYKGPRTEYNNINTTASENIL